MFPYLIKVSFGLIVMGQKSSLSSSIFLLMGGVLPLITVDISIPPEVGEGRLSADRLGVRRVLVVSDDIEL